VIEMLNAFETDDDDDELCRHVLGEGKATDLLTLFVLCVVPCTDYVNVRCFVFCDYPCRNEIAHRAVGAQSNAHLLVSCPESDGC